MKIIAGVDEVGRGPLAGPVIAAAVILDASNPVAGLKDSKKLTPKRREELAAIIKEKALCYAFGRAEASEIDKINILQASLLAMQRAVLNLSLQPAYAMIDGTFCPKLNCQTEAVVRGDQKIAEISAASIIAKVYRDREMIEFDALYPGYGFAAHKGYPAKQHLEALALLGPTPIHRLSFAPVKKHIKEHCA